MLRRLSLALLALGLLYAPVPAMAAPSGISSKVAVCNPSYPDRCLAPAANGSLPVTGGGGGGGASVTATAAAPTLVEGSTDNNISSNLRGEQRVILENAGVTATITGSNALKVDGSAVTQPVSGTVTATGPLTDTQLRATPVPVSGTVTANAGTGTMAVSGPLTDTQLRASAVPVSGTVTATVSGVSTAANQTTMITNAGSSADAAYTGTGSSLAAYMRAVADAAISTAATKTKLSPTATSTDGITPVVMSTAAACLVLKASPGNFYSLSGNIGAAGYVMVFDATSAPADGTVTPKIVLQTSAAGTFSISYGGLPPAVFATGMTACASSTGPYTKTAYSTNVFMSGQVQ